MLLPGLVLILVSVFCAVGMRVNFGQHMFPLPHSRDVPFITAREPDPQFVREWRWIRATLILAASLGVLLVLASLVVALFT